MLLKCTLKFHCIRLFFIIQRLSRFWCLLIQKCTQRIVFGGHAPMHPSFHRLWRAFA